MSAIIVDCETTGLTAPIRPVEIAWLRLSEPGSREWAEVCVQRFDPDRAIEFGAMATHHLTALDIIGQPLWSTFRLPEGVEYLIGHNVDFDWHVLGDPPVKRICTLALARWLWPACDSHTLGALLYLIDPGMARTVLPGQAHSAGGDVRACHRLLVAILERLDAVVTWEDLWQASEVARVPTHVFFGKYRGTPIKDLPTDYRKWMLNKQDMDPYLLTAVRDSLRRPVTA